MEQWLMIIAILIAPKKVLQKLYRTNLEKWVWHCRATWKQQAKNEFQLLEPFGNDNSSPVFLIKKIKILKFKIINDYHLQLLIKNDLKKTCLCFAFNSVGSKIGQILMNNKKNLDLIVQINNKIVQKNSDFNLIIKDAIVW